VSEDAIRAAIPQIVSELLPSGSVSAKQVRLRLQEKFSCILEKYKTVIRSELQRVVLAPKPESATPKADVSDTSSSGPGVQEVAPLGLAPNDLADGTTPAAAAGPSPGGGAAAAAVEPAREGGDSVDAKIPLGRGGSLGIELLDTRHNKAEELSARRIPLLFPKNLGVQGKTLQVLAELYQEGAVAPFNLEGDAGAVGRASMIDAQGKTHGLTAQKKGARSGSKKWADQAAKRYQQGSVLRLDLKGDVYHGTLAPTSVTMCAVTVTAGKEAKVSAVYNNFLRCDFQGNVLKGMRGKVKGAEADSTAEESGVARPKKQARTA